MKNITFIDQSIPMPEDFRACVTRAAHDYFPKRRKLGSINRFLDNHIEALQAAISLDFPLCQVRGKHAPDEIRFTIDLSRGDTGFSYIALPITSDSGAAYVGGMS